MTSPVTDPEREQRLKRVKDSIQRARELVASRSLHGVDGICNFVKDVDGDWLGKWEYPPESTDLDHTP